MKKLLADVLSQWPMQQKTDLVIERETATINPDLVPEIRVDYHPARLHIRYYSTRLLKSGARRLRSLAVGWLVAPSLFDQLSAAQTKIPSFRKLISRVKSWRTFRAFLATDLWLLAHIPLSKFRLRLWSLRCEIVFAHKQHPIPNQQRPSATAAAVQICTPDRTTATATSIHPLSCAKSSSAGPAAQQQKEPS